MTFNPATQSLAESMLDDLFAVSMMLEMLQEGRAMDSSLLKRLVIANNRCKAMATGYLHGNIEMPPHHA